MPREQRLHVVERVDRDALAPDLAFRPDAVGVVAHQGRHVECGREAGLAVVEQVAEALVGLLGGAEARELAHRPQAAAVHRRVHAARERILARVADVALAVVVGQVLVGVERLDRLAGDRGEQALALGLARVDLLQPLMGAALSRRALPPWGHCMGADRRTALELDGGSRETRSDMLSRRLLLAVASVTLILIGTAPAQAAFPGLNGKIAFTYTPGNPGTSGDIYVMQPDGSGAWSDHGPARRGARTCVVFRRHEDRLHAEPRHLGDERRWHRRRSTSPSSRPVQRHSPSWSPDGTKIAFSSSRSGMFGPEHLHHERRRQRRDTGHVRDARPAARLVAGWSLRIAFVRPTAHLHDEA